MATSNRTLWGVAALAVALVLVPLVGGLFMGGGMMGGYAMFGMHAAGLLWLVLTIVVFAALVALVVGGKATKT